MIAIRNNQSKTNGLLKYWLMNVMKPKENTQANNRKGNWK